MIIPIMGTETIDDLKRVEGKAELIAGRIVESMPAHSRHQAPASAIAASLVTHGWDTSSGQGIVDGAGFVPPGLPPTGRQSFCPDAAFILGHWFDDARFVPIAPTLAVEVRAEDDYGPVAEAEIAYKRAEYFAAGTLVVWDVDPNIPAIACFRASDPDTPVIFRTGDVAEAEPPSPDGRSRSRASSADLPVSLRRPLPRTPRGGAESRSVFYTMSLIRLGEGLA